jgi:crotonobetainyl-CoA:carnitine CoA-transferase CaiB-like acyl-CoA transferase
MPLDGVSVLDFTQTLAGPHCTWLLACMGADVVKVEAPGGDYLRRVKHGTMFAGVNRGKRSVVVDLRSEDGKRLAFEMAKRVDILVESFKPGVMDRMGLSYARVSAANPGLIYASISGFGQDGPYAGRPGYDVIAQALSGIMAATGEADRAPVRVGTGAVDCGTGTYAALGIVAALRRRETSGLGSRIDASLLETAMSWMAHAYTHFAYTGEDQVRRGTANESFVPYQVFQAADGDVFVGVGTDRMFSDFCSTFGLTDLAADPRFKTIAGRCAHREALVPLVAAALHGLPRNIISERLTAIGVPTAEILTAAQFMTDPHVQARHLLHVMEDAELGEITVADFPMAMDGVLREGGARAPKVDEHRAEVLAELGLAESAPADLTNRGA